jgi:hypothetical protein
MFNKKIITLEQKKKLREIELSLVHEIGAEPMTTEMYKNDIMHEIMYISNEIDYERSMKPLRYAAVIFAVVSALLLVYIVISEIL